MNKKKKLKKRFRSQHADIPHKFAENQLPAYFCQSDITSILF